MVSLTIGGAHDCSRLTGSPSSPSALTTSSFGQPAQFRRHRHPSILTTPRVITISISSTYHHQPQHQQHDKQ
jgi:hypothetical protein